MTNLSKLEQGRKAPPEGGFVGGSAVSFGRVSQQVYIVRKDVWGERPVCAEI